MNRVRRAGILFGVVCCLGGGCSRIGKEAQTEKERELAILQWHLRNAETKDEGDPDSEQGVERLTKRIEELTAHVE